MKYRIIFVVINPKAMPKLLLSADEELIYLHKLDAIKDMIPDLEIQVQVQPIPIRFHNADTGDVAEEFKRFLQDSKTTTETISTL